MLYSVDPPLHYIILFCSIWNVETAIYIGKRKLSRPWVEAVVPLRACAYA